MDVRDDLCAELYAFRSVDVAGWTIWGHHRPTPAGLAKMVVSHSTPAGLYLDMTTPPAPSDAAFRRFYERTSPRVYGYVRRRCPDADCDDVIAEAYLVAWRHFDELPADPVPWVLRAARNALSNHRRGLSRQQRLADEIGSILELAGPDCATLAVERTDLLAALAALREDDREVLLLAGWDGLDSAGIGTALGISAPAARTRLSRARHRLERQFARRSPAPGHAPSLLIESS
jgi:RNA polymerase sigma-70 factor (ECF subfamily)